MGRELEQQPGSSDHLQRQCERGLSQITTPDQRDSQTVLSHDRMALGIGRKD